MHGVHLVQSAVMLFSMFFALTQKVFLLFGARKSSMMVINPVLRIKQGDSLMNNWFYSRQYHTIFILVLALLTGLFLLLMYGSADQADQGTSPATNLQQTESLADDSELVQRQSEPLNQSFADQSSTESDHVNSWDQAFGLDIEFQEEYEDYSQWIIKWKVGFSRPEEQQFTIISLDFERHLMLVELDQDVDVQDWYENWIRRTDIEFLQPNQEIRLNAASLAHFMPQSVPRKTIRTATADEHPLYRYEDFFIKQMRLEQTSQEVVVAVVDTGVDLTHPLLQNHFVQGYSMFENDSSVEDLVNGHGTMVSGALVLPDEDNVYTQEELSNIKIMPIKVLNEFGYSDLFLTGSGIFEAVDRGADIIVLSLTDPFYSQYMQEAIEYAEDNGVLVVAATGNDSTNSVGYPAAYPTVIAVGAAGPQGNQAHYSNYGNELRIVAAGNVQTTYPNGETGPQSGTSMATPQVARLAAVLLQYYPGLTPAQVRNHMMYTANNENQDRWNIYTGFGMINPRQTLDQMPVMHMDQQMRDRQNPAIFPVKSEFRAELLHAEDEHFLYIPPFEEGSIDLEIDLYIGKQHGIQVTIYSEEEEQERELVKVNVNKQRNVQFQVPPRGGTLIHIHFHPDEKRTTPLPYRLVSEFTIYDDDQHPNHQMEDAYELLGDGRLITGTLNKDGIEDWFYFDSPGEGKIDLSVRVSTIRMDPFIDIIKPNGTIHTVDEGWFWESTRRIDMMDEYYSTDVEQGRYYLKVGNSRPELNKVNGEYYLSFSFTPGQ